MRPERQPFERLKVLAMTKYIGVYIGNILLEQDLEYQEWLRKGRPVSFVQYTGINQKTMGRLGRI